MVFGVVLGSYRMPFSCWIFSRIDWVFVEKVKVIRLEAGGGLRCW